MPSIPCPYLSYKNNLSPETMHSWSLIFSGSCKTVLVSPIYGREFNMGPLHFWSWDFTW